VLGEAEWESLAYASGARQIVVSTGGSGALAAMAAALFLGRAVRTGDDTAALPGRLETVGEHPLEIWDGAHNVDGARWLVGQLPERDFVLVASILADKDVDEMLFLLARRASRLVATSSRNPRALAAQDLGARARTLFGDVEIEPDPVAAVGRARVLAGDDGAVLVAGSLYLLAELAAVRPTSLP
jgi:dihydrofolate synthase/folylpolyglutamate synthase